MDRSPAVVRLARYQANHNIQQMAEVTESPMSNTYSKSWRGVAIAIAMLVFSFPLWNFFTYLWNREHYRFFPFILAAIGYFFWASRPLELFVPRGWRRLLSIVAGVAAAIALLLSPMLGPSWLSGVAIFLSLLAGSFWVQGNDRYSLVGAAMLFLMILPPPLNFDVQLIQKLQQFASLASSELLEFVGVSHLMRGNLTVLPEHTFFVEEACAGVHSLFSLAAATGILCVFMRRSLLVSVGLLGVSVFWALITNVVRIVAVVFAWDTWQIDLLTGWKHELLGLVVFAFAIGMCWSTASLVTFFLSPVKADFIDRQSTTVFHVIWNRFAAPTNKSQISQPQRQVPSSASISPLVRWSGVCAGIVLAIFLVGTNTAGSAMQSARLADGQVVNQLHELLDANFWSRAGEGKLDDIDIDDYTATDRDFMSSWGKHSREWTATTQQWSGRLSIDYLWQSQHHLEGCYRGIGWTVQEIVKQPGVDDTSWPVTLLSMKRTGGVEGVVLYSAVDSDGGIFLGKGGHLLPGAVDSRIRRGINEWLHVKDGAIQVQLFVPNVSREETEVIKQMIASFSAMRSVLRSQLASKMNRAPLEIASSTTSDNDGGARTQ
ncbi:exosortase U [Rosistilla oblonga]|uniref:exosortase U n=1 Tax=Rosistilla oblonga TaxID=2527990 RepID=UPI003A985744